MPAVPQMPVLGTTIVASPPLLLVTMPSRSWRRWVGGHAAVWAHSQPTATAAQQRSGWLAQDRTRTPTQPSSAAACSWCQRRRTCTACVRLLRSSAYLRNAENRGTGSQAVTRQPMAADSTV